jgi:hypothetical protein
MHKSLLKESPHFLSCRWRWYHAVGLPTAQVPSRGLISPDKSTASLNRESSFATVALAKLSRPAILAERERVHGEDNPTFQEVDLFI